jgi:hypothetical protein
MLPLYAARIEDLGPGDFVKVDCAACHHVALLTPDALLRGGLSPAAKVLDLKGRLRCRGCGAKGRAVVSIKSSASETGVCGTSRRLTLRAFPGRTIPARNGPISEDRSPGW